MVGRDGRVKVLDFGLAKLAAEEPAPGAGEPAADSATRSMPITREGAVMGTVPYMSPEQLRGSPVDHRTDVFSLGVLLYELATGQRPFGGPSTSDVTSAILRDAPPLVTQPKPELPRQLARIVAHCLEKEPERRFQSARDVRNELEALRDEVRLDRAGSDPTGGGAAAQVPAAEHPGSQAPAWQRKVVWLVGGAAAAAAAAALVLLWGRGAEGPAPTAGPATTELPAAPPAGMADPHSIAVLPFQNLSAEAENAFFAAGVHEDVLTHLSRVADLRVISRSSVMQYAEPEQNVKQIAADLGVSYIVEGSVRRAAGQVRVTAQLIDARSDEHLWADNFDRELEDVFTIQTAIATEIVRELKANLTPREAEHLTSRPTTSVEAYDLYLEARQRIHQRDVSEYAYEAERLLEQAIRLDPQFARAYTLLAHLHGGHYWFQPGRTPERLARMKEAIDRAFELDPDLPEARLALAEYYYRGFYDYPRALEQLELARRSMPNNARLFYTLGLTYRRVGQHDRSVDSFERSFRLDPANAPPYYEAVNTACSTGRVERCLALAEAAGRRFPAHPDIVGVRASTSLILFGDIGRARSILDAVDAGSRWPFANARYLTSLFERDFREAAEAAMAPSYFDAIAPGWGPTRAAEALALGGFEAEAEKRLRQGESILAGEVAKPYAEAYAWPHYAYAENLSLQGRHRQALASCDRATSILPFDKDKVHGALFRQECAWVTARSGEIDQALDEIEWFLEHGWGFSRWELALSPRWDFLRDNPRFRELATPSGNEAG